MAVVPPPSPSAYALFRRRVWEILDARHDDDGLSRAVSALIFGLILLNVVAVILGTVASFRAAFAPQLRLFEVFSVIIFSAEYALRVWSAPASPRFNGRAGRLRFALTPLALIDLLAVLPFYLPFVGIDLRFARALRLVRVFRVLKVSRYVAALVLFRNVWREKREELVVTVAVLLLLLVVTSSLMYYAEHGAQPGVFSSIPSTMWWSVATLTTVGYGDVYPVTLLGKVLAAAVACLGIGVFALPTAILGSGFVEEIERRKEPRRCPHCSEIIA